MAAKIADPKIPVWPTLRLGEVSDHAVFGVQTVVRRSPRTGLDGQYKVLHMPAWTNVVALTPEDEVVLVEQFRHGVNEVTLEIPGGVVEEGEPPEAAAARELLEETGFQGQPPQLLGTVQPNPAIQNNVCTTWLITEALQVAAPQPDPGEHIEVHVVPRAEIPGLMRASRITHSLVVAAFHWLGLYEADRA